MNAMFTLLFVYLALRILFSIHFFVVIFSSVLSHSFFLFLFIFSLSLTLSIQRARLFYFPLPLCCIRVANITEIVSFTAGELKLMEHNEQLSYFQISFSSVQFVFLCALVSVLFNWRRPHLIIIIIIICVHFLWTFTVPLAQVDDCHFFFLFIFLTSLQRILCFFLLFHKFNYIQFPMCVGMPYRHANNLFGFMRKVNSGNSRNRIHI